MWIWVFLSVCAIVGGGVCALEAYLDHKEEMKKIDRGEDETRIL